MELETACENREEYYFEKCHKISGKALNIF